MFVVTVLYPGSAAGDFNRDYYMRSHIPLVKARWGEFGLSSVQVLRALGTPGGEQPTHSYIAVLTFGSQQQFQQAVQAHGKEVLGDVPNFTKAAPVIQFNEVLE